MPFRTLADATDLNSWALRRDAQEYLPLLLRRLVHATAVRDVIEAVNSDDLDRSFKRSVYNSRGTVRKTIAEGGGQERRLAETYQAYARMVQDRWPRTAALLRRIADDYAAEAREEDVRAELEEDLLR